MRRPATSKSQSQAASERVSASRTAGMVPTEELGRAGSSANASGASLGTALGTMPHNVP